MPNYTIVQQRLSSYSEAAALLARLRQIYDQCNEVAAAVELYQAATSPDFNAAINAIFVPAERAELAAMLTDVQQLVSLWDANHAALLAHSTE